MLGPLLGLLGLRTYLSGLPGLLLGLLRFRLRLLWLSWLLGSLL